MNAPWLLISTYESRPDIKSYMDSRVVDAGRFTPIWGRLMTKEGAEDQESEIEPNQDWYLANPCKAIIKDPHLDI